jgi:hypothetical protein
MPDPLTRSAVVFQKETHSQKTKNINSQAKKCQKILGLPKTTYAKKYLAPVAVQVCARRVTVSLHRCLESLVSQVMVQVASRVERAAPAFATS